MRFLQGGEEGGGTEGGTDLLLSVPPTKRANFVACGLVANVWLSSKQEIRSLLTQTPVRIDITNLQTR